MDGFHNPRAVRYRQGRESAAGYYEDAYDFPGLRRVLLGPLGPGGDLRYGTAMHDLASDVAVDATPVIAPDDLVLVVDGSFLQRRDLADAWDVTVYLRAEFATARARGAARDARLLGSEAEAGRLFEVRYHAACRRYLDEVDPEGAADIVVDNDDPRQPQLVRVAAALTDLQPHLRRTRTFFGSRAAQWDERFPDDDAAYAAAIDELRPPPGGVAVDLGCGTGRAVHHLREHVGESGTVVACDVTAQMLQVALAKGRGRAAHLVIADAASLPVADNRVDAFLAAGLLTHVPSASELLQSLALRARPGCRLAVFHPIGRAALARRHGRTLRADELLDPSVLPGVLEAAGWELERIDDADHRYLALAHTPR